MQAGGRRFDPVILHHHQVSDGRNQVSDGGDTVMICAITIENKGFLESFALSGWRAGEGLVVD